MVNFNLRGLELRIRAKSNAIADRAPEIVADFAHNGEVAMEEIIVEATTPTGEARGRSPGRIDTGLMINSVNSRSTTNGQESVGEFGWTAEQLKYFDYQENGTKYIEAMNALSGAFVQAKQIAIRDITSAIRDDRL